MHKVKEIVSIIKGLLGKLSQKIKPCLPYIYKVGNLLKKISPTRYLSILDWYIIKKFIGTYIYAILLIISIAIVFDFNENLSKFTQYHAPWRASSLITMPTSYLIIPTSSHHYLYSLLLYSSHLS